VLIDGIQHCDDDWSIAEHELLVRRRWHHPWQRDASLRLKSSDFGAVREVLECDHGARLAHSCIWRAERQGGRLDLNERSANKRTARASISIRLPSYAIRAGGCSQRRTEHEGSLGLISDKNRDAPVIAAWRQPEGKNGDWNGYWASDCWQSSAAIHPMRNDILYALATKADRIPLAALLPLLASGCTNEKNKDAGDRKVRLRAIVASEMATAGQGRQQQRRGGCGTTALCPRQRIKPRLDFI